MQASALSGKYRGEARGGQFKVVGTRQYKAVGSAQCSVRSAVYSVGSSQCSVGGAQYSVGSDVCSEEWVVCSVFSG